MAQRQLAEHLAEQVIEITAAGEPVEVRPILARRLRQIEAMMARIVDEVALQPPDLVVHLLPFSLRIDAQLHVIDLQGVVRDAAWSGGAADDPALALAIEQLV